MKIIFDDYIKDYSIELISLVTNNNFMTLISGTFKLSLESYQEIEEKLPERHYFSIVSDNLKQYYQKCRMNTLPFQVALSSGKIDIHFVVITVGKSSIHIPTEELQTAVVIHVPPASNGWTVVPNYYHTYSTGNSSSTWNTSFRMPQGDH